MRLNLKVKANARQQKIEPLQDGSLKIAVVSVPENGKANEEIIELLADYFDVAKSKIRIIRGHGASNKLVEILGI